MKTKTQKNWKK